MRDDRCFLELQVEGQEAYQTFRRVIETADVVMATYEDPLLGDVQVHPEHRTVFSAGLLGWALPRSMQPNLESMSWRTRVLLPVSVVQLCNEPTRQIIDLCMTDQKERWWPMLQKLGVTMKAEERQPMGKAFTKRSCKLGCRQAMPLLRWWYLPPSFSCQGTKVSCGEGVRRSTRWCVYKCNQKLWSGRPSYAVCVEDDSSFRQGQILRFRISLFPEGVNRKQSSNHGTKLRSRAKERPVREERPKKSHMDGKETRGSQGRALWEDSGHAWIGSVHHEECEREGSRCFSDQGDEVLCIPPVVRVAVQKHACKILIQWYFYDISSDLFFLLYLLSCSIHDRFWYRDRNYHI